MYIDVGKPEHGLYEPPADYNHTENVTVFTFYANDWGNADDAIALVGDDGRMYVHFETFC